jgi:hypothetical protein
MSLSADYTRASGRAVIQRSPSGLDGRNNFSLFQIPLVLILQDDFEAFLLDFQGARRKRHCGRHQF